MTIQDDTSNGLVNTTKAADQKYCHSCGGLLHHSATNCTHCGAVQAALAPPPAMMMAAAVTPVAASAAIAGVPPLPAQHVYCRGCGAGIHETAHACPKCGAPQRVAGSSGLAAGNDGRSRVTAAILALVFGGFGLHKFYLGHIFVGLLYLVFCWTFIPAVVAFIEGIYYLTLSDAEFSRRY